MFKQPKAIHTESHSYRTGQHRQSVPVVNVAWSSVSDVLSRLHEYDLVRKDRRGQQAYYSLRRNALELVIEQQKKRNELDNLHSELANSES